MSAAAEQLWCDGYPALTAAQPGLLGAITARAEAQTLRLSLIYALLDGAREIDREHVEAALALWAYCGASARFVFGDLLGNAMADTILGVAAQGGARRHDAHRDQRSVRVQPRQRRHQSLAAIAADDRQGPLREAGETAGDIRPDAGDLVRDLTRRRRKSMAKPKIESVSRVSPRGGRPYLGTGRDRKTMSVEWSDGSVREYGGFAPRGRLRGDGRGAAGDLGALPRRSQSRSRRGSRAAATTATSSSCRTRPAWKRSPWYGSTSGQRSGSGRQSAPGLNLV